MPGSGAHLFIKGPKCGLTRLPRGIKKNKSRAEKKSDVGKIYYTINTAVFKGGFFMGIPVFHLFYNKNPILCIIFFTLPFSPSY